MCIRDSSGSDSFDRGWNHSSWWDRRLSSPCGDLQSIKAIKSLTFTWPVISVMTTSASTTHHVENSEEEEKPTPREVFREFLVFRMNHRENEVLFKHDYFTDIMAREYNLPHFCLNTNDDLLNVMSTNPMSHFFHVLLQCDPYVSSRGAREDLCCVLSYAKEAL